MGEEMACRRAEVSSPGGAVSAQDYDSLYESAMMAAAEALAGDFAPNSREFAPSRRDGEPPAKESASAESLAQRLFDAGVEEAPSIDASDTGASAG